MPAGFLTVSAFLLIGYLLFLAEIVVPGGILGILGTAAVVYGCYQAFDLGVAWGAGSIVISVIVFAGGIRFLLFSKTGRALTLEDNSGPKTWKSNTEDWQHLVGTEGVTVSPLRPAGVAKLEDQRRDVVSESEFLDAGVAIRVVEVEGRRIVVEPAAGRQPLDDTEGAKEHEGGGDEAGEPPGQKLLSEKLQSDTQESEPGDELPSARLQDTD
ncbi:MAG: hypothetical protein MI919_08920 [Holophagales bacterium]|nr:hypothetical protein [Holophagales bacterium]